VTGTPPLVGPGRVAVVTGAASGIGLGLSRRFAAEGMAVVLADVEEPALSTAAAELATQGARVRSVVTDVSHAA
jgi:NAD(P)-dependent dehydrogenase (short-subunit alcohol dehydrogenase family)